MGISCSLVINNYNYGRFLAESVSSAVATGAEVVVVDDGSTDNSLEILTDFGDRVISVGQPNGGQAAAINSGIAAATGDVVLLLDADDMVRPNRTERVADAFRSWEVQWLRHDMIYFDERGASSLAYDFEGGSDPKLELQRTGQVQGSTSGLAFRQSFLQTLGPIPEADFRFSADFYLLSAGAIAGGGVTLQEPLTLRRVHPQQIVKQLSQDREMMVRQARQKASMARHDRDLAQRFGTLPLVASEQTWWQQKWIFDYLRFQGRNREAWTAWRRHVAALRRAPIPASQRAAEATRSTLLALTPASFFPSMWWATHNGRSGVTSKIARALARAR
jgi:glycosyltransferase involved in cell wall biosynthesis